MPKLSVIICTYNPVQEVFQQCLGHLLEASRHCTPFEVLIIDNNSRTPVADEMYVKLFIQQVPYTRVVAETKQGLTPARLKGINESKGDILVFIDDDNFISGDFLLKGLEIAGEYKEIGSWSGQVKLKFEAEPPAWSKRYWGLLVYREFSGNRWSNLPHLPETMPCGAGLFVRREVADHYVKLHHEGKRNIQLDRTAGSLFSAGDNDLAACACDIGLGVGIFSSIILTHYIPAERITKNYLLRLAEGIAHSGIVFRSFRNEMPESLNLKRKVANSLRLLFKTSIDREFQKAVYRGEENGRTFVRTHNHSV